MTRATLLNGTALFLAAITAGGFAATASAQTAPGATDTSRPDDSTGTQSPSGAGDIVVTARKRDERLIDVPIAIQAFSHDEIKTAGITDLRTLTSRAGFQFPPQVSNGPAGRFSGVLIFRGLQANSFGAQRDNSGSLFVDGIYVSGGVQSVNTADVERIEVLKGPQNAYFGRSTFGGAVNFITRKPSDTFGGEVNVRGTARGNVDADVSVEGPLVKDMLTARVTGYIHNRVAQYHATDGGDLGAERSQGVTGTLYFTPSANSFLRLRASYQHDDDSAPVYAFLPANTYAAGACAGRTFPGFNGVTGTGPITLARNYFCNGYPTIKQTGTGIITQNTGLPAAYRDAIRSTIRSTAGGIAVPFFDHVPDIDHFGLTRNNMFLSGQGGYTFDSGFSIAFNAGYNQQDSVDINDVDKTDVLLGFLDTLAFRTRDLTLDARVASDPAKPIRALLGVSYFSGATQFADIQYSAFAPISRGGNYTNERARTPAVYGSIDVDILHNLTLTGEGRYQEDKIISYNAAGVKIEQTFKDFLPRAILKFAPIPDANVYVSYSRGVQPAGVNTGFGALSALPFATQAVAYVQSVYPGIGLFSLVPKLDAYEFGVKQKLMDGAVDYTLAVYQNDWKNATTTSALFNPSPACFPAGAAAITNTAACPLGAGGTSTVTPNDARIRGIEFGITGHLGSALTLDLTADYKDAKWRRYANTGFNVFAGLPATGAVYRADGNKIGRVPSLTGTFSATYRGDLGGEWHWYARGDALYTGKAWDSDLNIFQTNDFVRVNTNVGVTRDNVTIEMFTTNLFNDQNYDAIANTVALTGDFTQRALAVVPAQRREFGVRTQIKF